jgi:hypothetical protein
LSRRCRGFIPKFVKCKIEKEKYLKRQEKFRALIKNLAQKYKNVYLLDPEDIFCDRIYCYVYHKEKTLYADDDHLSKYGSSLVSRKIISLLKRLKIIE